MSALIDCQQADRINPRRHVNLVNCYVDQLCISRGSITGYERDSVVAALSRIGTKLEPAAAGTAIVAEAVNEAGGG